MEERPKSGLLEDIEGGEGHAHRDRGQREAGWGGSIIKMRIRLEFTDEIFDDREQRRRFPSTKQSKISRQLHRKGRQPHRTRTLT